MRYDLIFILTALACLLGGESLGVWMGVNGDFTLAPAHAHLNLAGWATLAAYGLIHRAYPGLAAAAPRLSAAQCALSVLGGVLMPIGIGVSIVQHNDQLATWGALGVLLGTLLMIVMVARNARSPQPAAA